MSPQRPPGTGPPVNLSGPGPFGTVHIDVAAPVASSSNHNHSDLAGVLRRNQACLQCRKRKLKCDAARPHCATCVRSYRHSLRTAPKSNPVLCCDYDDGAGTHEDEGQAAHHSVSPSAGAEDDDNGGAKKKRKASGEGKRKKKGEEFEEERNRLTRQIEELQAQLSRKEQQPSQQQWVDGDTQTADKTWSSTARPFQDTTIAPSPTAFLEMLSSAASSKEAAGQQHSQQAKSALSSSSVYNTNGNVMNPGPMFGIGGQEEMHDINAQPFRSMFAYDAPQQEASINAIDMDTSPDSANHLSRQTSAHDDRASGSNGFNSGDSASAPSTNILSPNGIFNFSPVPAEATENIMWPPPLTNPNGTIEPTTRIDGPWKAVETIDTVLGSMSAAMGQDIGMDLGADFNLDGLQAGLDASVQEQLLMDLFWPGWPNNLPEPNVVTDLIEAFFEHVPNLPRLLHRPRFLARMALPPTHSNFPHPALIHAVCAAAAAWCPPEIYEKSKKAQQWSFESATYSGIGMYSGGVDFDKPKTKLSFGLRQASFAKEAVTDGLNTGNRLFDVIRAMIILCRVFIDDTRMLECWAYGGLVARMVLPLGLNVRSAELSLKSVMLPPPADALEREERRAAIWMAFYYDSIASAASGWGTSISLDELTVPLPVSAKDFELGEPFIAPNPQDIESSDLWVKHPVADSFVMAVKASLLINRVNRFARRWKNRHLRDNDDFEGMSRPEFSELSNAIACFQMSFPPGLRNICRLNAKGKFDMDIIAAHMLPYAAIICLYEPFADVADPSDQAARRILNAAQGICALVQQLAGAFSRDGTNFASDMHASVSVCLVTSCRTLLVFLRHALNVGDEATASIYKMEVETMRIALGQFGLRFKIGHHHSQLIEYFTDRCLNPTYEKLSAHYPEHPRTGAMELTKDSNMGLCVTNALNVKRGFWRLPKLSFTSATTSTGVSPLQSTPESMGSTGSGSGSGSGSGFSQRSGSRSGSGSTDTRHTSTSIHNQGNAGGSGSGLTTEEELRFQSTLDVRPDGHMALLFGQTEDDAANFCAERARTSANANANPNADVNTLNGGGGGGGHGKEVNRPGYGVDSNGSNIEKISCTPWPKGRDHSSQNPIADGTLSTSTMGENKNELLGGLNSYPFAASKNSRNVNVNAKDVDVDMDIQHTKIVRSDGVTTMMMNPTEDEIIRFSRQRTGY